MEAGWLKQAIDFGVLGLLFALSVMAIAVVLERVFFFRGPAAGALR